MIELIYGSSACQPMTWEQIEDLLRTSRAKNAAKGVTGLLLYQDGSFIQALEGEAAAVEELFREIAADPRHSGVLVLSRGEIERRSFADWSMGFHHLPPGHHAELDGLFELSRSSLDAHVPDDVSLRTRALLRSFYDITSDESSGRKTAP